MDLIANGLYRATRKTDEASGLEPGLYRVILNDMLLPKVVMALAQAENLERRGRGGRPKKRDSELKRPRKKSPAPFVGQLLWVERQQLQHLWDKSELMPLQQERSVAPALSDKGKADYERRIAVMAGFLDVPNLQENILVHEGLAGLVKAAVEEHKCSRHFVYKQWSSLVRWGIAERSLWPQFHRCGAPGKTRTCDTLPDGSASRKKAGRKTLKQRIDIAFGKPSDPEQPGMSELWAARIRAADRRIPEPKPAWPSRCEQIIGSHFCSRVKEVDGRIELVRPEIGSYPNNRQIRRVLDQARSQLQRILERTTKQYFKSALRGLTARNWQGVAGPGHTFAIDSTIGDIYLRSSVNRAWIVGRPVVYVIVDVWSTAVVGFYVCLTGPSWSTAKVSIFNAAADPALVAGLWGCHPILGLDPAPTLCAWLMCDRGEYLSAGHRSTALKLKLSTSYAPPYRGDLKGIVEVLHRIAKDELFLFIPGAMNHRRAEMELRKVNPADSVLTLQEYTQVLYEVFSNYNLGADRSKRLDQYMTAARVFPTPAGLWNYGHRMGVGFRREVHFDDLASTLLSTGKAWVARDAVRFAGNDYMSDEVRAAQWTAIARNVEGWELDASFYPGSMRHIWVPKVDGGNLTRLDLTDESRAAPQTTYDEWLDVRAEETMRGAEVAHQQMLQALQSQERIARLRDQASQLTDEAISKASGKAPSMAEARAGEVAMNSHLSGSEATTKEAIRDEALEEHETMMAALLAGANAKGGSHV